MVSNPLFHNTHHNLALKGRNTHDHFSLVSTSLNNRIWKCPFPSKICLIFEAKQMLFHTTSFLIMKDFSLFKVFINLNQSLQQGLRTTLNKKVQKIEWLQCRKVDQNSSKCKKWGGRCALNISDATRPLEPFLNKCTYLSGDHATADIHQFAPKSPFPLPGCFNCFLFSCVSAGSHLYCEHSPLL